MHGKAEDPDEIRDRRRNDAESRQLLRQHVAAKNERRTAEHAAREAAHANMLYARIEAEVFATPDAWEPEFTRPQAERLARAWAFLLAFAKS